MPSVALLATMHHIPRQTAKVIVDPVCLWAIAKKKKTRSRLVGISNTYLYSVNTYEMSLTIDIPMRSFACCLSCLFPLTIYTSPFLRISFAPVLVLIFRRLSPPAPITKPLYSAAISTNSPGGGAVVFHLCISFCRDKKKMNFQIVLLANQLHIGAIFLHDLLFYTWTILFEPSLRSKQS